MNTLDEKPAPSPEESPPSAGPAPGVSSRVGAAALGAWRGWGREDRAAFALSLIGLLWVMREAFGRHRDVALAYLMVSLIFTFAWRLLRRFENFLPLWPLFLTLGMLCAPMFRVYFWYSHEESFAIIRVMRMSEAWAAGGPFNAPWFPESCHGYGWPFFTFYAPFGYYAAALAHELAGMGFGAATKLSFAMSMALGGLFVYLFAIEASGGGALSARARWWACAAAIIYTVAPYHLCDVFERGSLAESWGFAFVAGLFWSAEYARRKPWGGMLAVSATFGALVLSHNATAVYGVAFLVAWALLSWRPARWPISLAAGGLLGLGLSAYFWAPAMALKDLTRAGIQDLMGTEPASIRAHAIPFGQHLMDRWGNGGSHPGFENDFTVTLGVVNVAMVGIVALALALGRIPKDGRRSLSAALALLGVALFIVSPCVNWDRAPELLRYIQFPWRALVFGIFFVAASVALASGALDKWMHPLAVCAFAVITTVPNAHHLFIQVPPAGSTTRNGDDEARRWNKEQDRAGNFDGAIWREYLPISVDPNLLSDTKRVEANPIPEHRLALPDGVDLLSFRRRGSAYSYQFNSRSEAAVRVNLIDFPGWELTIDGQPEPQRLGRTDDGVLEIKLPAGERRVRLEYALSPIGKRARAVSAGFGVLWLVLAGCGSAAPWAGRSGVVRRLRAGPLTDGRVRAMKWSATMLVGSLAGGAFLGLARQVVAAHSVESSWSHFVRISAPGDRLLCGALRKAPAVPPDQREVLFASELYAGSRKSVSNNRAMLSKWLRESAGTGGRKVYVDAAARHNLDKLWGREDGVSVVVMAYEIFDFVPHLDGGLPLYELRLRPYDTGGPQETYPAEDWGGVSVRWTHRLTRIPAPQGSRLRLNYMIQHPDAGEGNPVVVTLTGAGRVLSSSTHDRAGFYSQTVVTPQSSGATVDLVLEVNRIWFSPEGRDLGVALYPLEFIP